jgi:hypothetical protein
MSESPFSIQMTTIGMVLWNPTEEDFHMQYAGISITLKAGQEEAFAMKCATHLLNAYGQRGLTGLTYGCNKEKVGEDGVRRNFEFRKKQVVEYNQRNEARKQMRLGYLPPTEELKKYAIQLGIKLLEPYSVRDEERSAISETALQNEALRKQVADQAYQIEQITAILKQMNNYQEPEPEPEPEKKKRT